MHNSHQQSAPPVPPWLLWHRPDASQVASDLLAFASLLVKQRSGITAQPDAALVGQRSGRVPLAGRRSGGAQQPEPVASQAAAAAPGQRSGSAQPCSTNDSTAAAAGSLASLQSVGD